MFEQHSPPFQGGVGVVKIEPQSAPYFVEVTNRPVRAERNGAILLEAQPPRLGKAGNVAHTTFAALLRIQTQLKVALYDESRYDGFIY
jgi:hypothetical protein